MKSTRKRRALWRTWLSSVLLSGALASAVTAAPLLDKATIIRLYENMLVEDGNPPPDLSDADVVWKEGSLTSPGATEAIASVTSVAAFAHVQGFAHVLFLRYSGGWIDARTKVKTTRSHCRRTS